LISFQKYNLNQLPITDNQLKQKDINSSFSTVYRKPALRNQQSLESAIQCSPGPSSERRLKFSKRSKTVTKEYEKQLKFISSNGSLTMRSFDNGEISDVEVNMKPLNDRSRSLSPLKQLKTYSFRSTPSEEGILSDIQQEMIRNSWQTIVTKLESSQSFGYFVFQRVFERNSLLKKAFHVEEYKSFESVPEEHSIFRQMRLFTNVISLAVRNVSELEMQIAPALFSYGQRHYGVARDYFNEETVRLFCSQVVCTVADILETEFEPACMEAWIEMMRFIGTKLLDGFDYVRLSQNKKILLNTNDHVFYVL
uniref:GLOBIN domain-containing protein n=1 Tax=Thelazia callipaeda TaxID=103827 RepID=A0A0N5CNF9_THECL